MTNLRVTVEDTPSSEDVSVIVRGLVASNDDRAQREQWRGLAVFLRDDRGAIVGGVRGHTHWDWLFVSHLWVCDTLRGRGHGTALMRAAEDEARRRGCCAAWLDTFDFQALGFYEKLGYVRFGKLDDFPRGHARWFLRKQPLA